VIKLTPPRNKPAAIMDHPASHNGRSDELWNERVQQTYRLFYGRCLDPRQDTHMSDRIQRACRYHAARGITCLPRLRLSTYIDSP
jgi:hypothetical protein